MGQHSIEDQNKQVFFFSSEITLPQQAPEMVGGKDVSSMVKLCNHIDVSGRTVIAMRPADNAHRNIDVIQYAYRLHEAGESEHWSKFRRSCFLLFFDETAYQRTVGLAWVAYGEVERRGQHVRICVRHRTQRVFQAHESFDNWP